MVHLLTSQEIWIINTENSGVFCQYQESDTTPMGIALRKGSWYPRLLCRAYVYVCLEELDSMRHLGSKFGCRELICFVMVWRVLLCA